LHAYTQSALLFPVLYFSFSGALFFAITFKTHKYYCAQKGRYSATVTLFE
jgi:hypothetical protein